MTLDPPAAASRPVKRAPGFWLDWALFIAASLMIAATIVSARPGATFTIASPFQTGQHR
jgi:hypothetical protein